MVEFRFLQGYLIRLDVALYQNRQTPLVNNVNWELSESPILESEFLAIVHPEWHEPVTVFKPALNQQIFLSYASHKIRTEFLNYYPTIALGPEQQSHSLMEYDKILADIKLKVTRLESQL